MPSRDWIALAVPNLESLSGTNPPAPTGVAEPPGHDGLGFGLLIGSGAIVAGGLACIALQFVAFAAFGAQSPWRLVFLLASLVALVAAPLLAASWCVAGERTRAAWGVALAAVVGLPLLVWLTT